MRGNPHVRFGGRAEETGLPKRRHRASARSNHTYAALMIRAGAEPKYLQSQMGHSSIRTTYDDYGHLFPNANRAVLGAFDELTRTNCPSIAPIPAGGQLSLAGESGRLAGLSIDGRTWD